MHEKKITHLKAAEYVLEKVSKPLTVREIWQEVEKQGLIDRINGSSPAKDTLGSLLAREISKNLEGTIFCKHEKEKLKDFNRWSLRSGQDLESNKTNKKQDEEKAEQQRLERELHAVLAYFVARSSKFYGENTIHTKTIDSSTSGGGKKYKEWLHPDMVGVLAPFDTFSKEVINLSNKLGTNTIFKLFSFELKQKLEGNNYRESFFQSVSNSSWAHEGYLVAKDISQDPDFLGNLERLSNAFGIGVIRLDLKNVSESEIVFPAALKKELDLATFNELYSNNDFKEFVDQLDDALQIKDITPVTTDEICDEEELAKHIKEKFGVESVEEN